MNRILYKKTELAHDQLLLTDHRATHILQVLKPALGDTLRTGEIDGALSEAEVLKMEHQKVVLKITPLELPPRPELDLLLAMPRPKVLKRLLPQIAAMGVDRIWLVKAERVEKYYFDTHVLSESFLFQTLMEGLQQSGDTCLPRVEVVRHLPAFLERTEFPENRWILHPHGGERFLRAPVNPGRRMIAIGPEGGWRQSELELFATCGFSQVTLFDRILRSDTACVVALGIAAAKGAGHGGA